MSLKISKQSILVLFMSILVIATAMVARSAAAQSFMPPAVATSSTITAYTGATNSQIQAVAVDTSGNIFFSLPNSGELMEQPAGGGAATILYTTPTGGAGYPKGIAVDHAGNAYISDYSGHLWKVPIAGGTATDILTSCNTLDAYYLGTQTIAIDGSNNVYVAGNNESSIFKITPAGVCSIIATGDTSSYVAADGAGDVFYSVSGTSLYEVPAGFTTPIQINGKFTAINGLRADSYGDLFVSDASTIDEIPYVIGSVDAALEFSVLPNSSGNSIGVGSNGALYTTDGNNISESTLGSVNLGSTAVATQSSAVAVNLLFNSAQTLSSLAFTAGAAATTEVSNTGAGTCATGTSYAAGSSCTLTLSVTPGNVGARKYSVQLLSDTTVIGSVAVSATGSGAALTVDPATQMNLGSSWTAPDGVAVDTSGNIFIADQSAGTVSYLAAGSSTPVVIASSLSSPSGLAVDGSGNVFVANTGAGTLVEIPYANGAFGSTNAVATGFKTPTGVAVGNSGSVYVTDPGAGNVYRFQNNAGVVDFDDEQTYGTGFVEPSGIATDESGNLYVADQSAGTIIEFTNGAQSTIITGLSSPVSLAVAPSGSLVVAQKGSVTLEWVPYVSGAYETNGTSELGSGFAKPVSVAMDSSDNLYVADQTQPAVVELERTAATLNLGKFNEGEQSAAEILTLSDAGDASLTLGSPFYTSSGNTGDFTLDTTGSDACAGSGVLDAGTACTVSATFSPTATGTLSEVLAFSSNAVNAAPTATLTGIGTDLPKTTTMLSQVTVGSISYGESVTVSATVTQASGAAEPTGTVQFFVNGTSYESPVSLALGAASITITGLPAQSNSVAATYSGDSNYAASTATQLTIPVSLAATTTALKSTATSSVPVPPGTSVTLTATIASGVTISAPTGSVTFTASGTSLANSPVMLATEPIVGGVATLTTTTLPQGTYTVSATYSGDTGFAGSASNTVDLAVLPPQYMLSSTPTSLSLSAPGSVTTSFVLTPISGYTGGVDLQCSGLPTNTSCAFTPGTVYFANTTNSSGATVPPGPQTVKLTLQSNTAPATTEADWLLPLGGLMFLAFARKRRLLRGYSTLGLVVLTVIFLGGAGLQGCSTSSPQATPTGASAVMVTLTGSPNGITNTVPASGSGNIVKTFTFTLNVK